MKAKINPGHCVPTNNLLLVEVIEIEQEEKTAGGIFKNPQRLVQEREHLLVVARLVKGSLDVTTKGKTPEEDTVTRVSAGALVIVNKEYLEPFNIPTTYSEPLYVISEHNVITYYTRDLVGEEIEILNN